MLIGQCHSRTVRYLQCLAAGVACLSYLWIYDCIKSNRLLEHGNYFLPTGFSILENRIISDGYGSFGLSTRPPVTCIGLGTQFTQKLFPPTFLPTASSTGETATCFEAFGSIWCPRM